MIESNRPIAFYYGNLITLGFKSTHLSETTGALFDFLLHIPVISVKDYDQVEIFSGNLHCPPYSFAGNRRKSGKYDEYLKCYRGYMTVI